MLERFQKGQEEARRVMASAIKYIAELFVADGERTRELLRARGQVYKPLHTHELCCLWIADKPQALNEHPFSPFHRGIRKADR